MIAAADRRFLLVDHTKFGRPALHLLAALSAFDEVMTGAEPDAAHRAALAEAGARLAVVAAEDNPAAAATGTSP